MSNGRAPRRAPRRDLNPTRPPLAPRAPPRRARGRRRRGPRSLARPFPKTSRVRARARTHLRRAAARRPCPCRRTRASRRRRAARAPRATRRRSAAQRPARPCRTPWLAAHALRRARRRCGAVGVPRGPHRRAHPKKNAVTEISREAFRGFARPEGARLTKPPLTTRCRAVPNPREGISPRARVRVSAARHARRRPARAPAHQNELRNAHAWNEAPVGTIDTEMRTFPQGRARRRAPASAPLHTMRGSAPARIAWCDWTRTSPEEVLGSAFAP